MPILCDHNIKLIVVGAKGWKNSNIGAIVNAPSFPKNNVFFTGKISDEELRLLYNVADTLCLPSINEGFGLPILEAISCHCRVVCADNSAMTEIDNDSITKVSGWNKSDWINSLLHSVNIGRSDNVTIEDKYLWPNIISSFHNMLKNI